MSDQVNMDAILDEALDELDDEEEDGNDLPAQAANESLPTPSRLMDTKKEEQPPSDVPPNDNNGDQDNILELAEGDLGSDVGGDAQSPAAVFQNMLKEFIQAEDDDEGDPEERLGQFMNQVQSKLPGKDSKSSSSEKDSKTTGPENDVEKTMAAILEEMSKANINGEPADIHEDEFLKEMFQNLQGGAGDDFNPESLNPDAVIDGMMEQLLSKDLMYEPMKHVTEKFPTWLQENKATLSPKDYEDRSKQYQCFKKLVHVYETQPENVTDLLELMQEVQEYGQPPQEIINEIAPGLEIDEDGMPKMNPMAGMPFGGGNEECRIM